MKSCADRAQGAIPIPVWGGFPNPPGCTKEGTSGLGNPLHRFLLSTTTDYCAVSEIADLASPKRLPACRELPVRRHSDRVRRPWLDGSPGRPACRTTQGWQGSLGYANAAPRLIVSSRGLPATSNRRSRIALKMRPASPGISDSSRTDTRQQESIAAVPGDPVAGSDRVVQHPLDRLEQFIARFVSERLVDLY